jgi:hypothetical protein
VKFWKIEAPYYESDYEEVYVNGLLYHPFSLPGVECDTCGQKWGGSRILPYTCPIALQKNKLLRDSGPIPLSQHKVLWEEVLTELRNEEIIISKLFPGDIFQPCYLDVPSKPTSDFLWASLGSLIVSERVKNMLLEHCAGDVSCCEVILRKVGKFDSKLPAPIPETGEPDSIIDRIEVESLPLYSLGSYYEVCIMNESELPPGCEIVNFCSKCGRVEFDTSKREIRMIESMWRGSQIFFLATTMDIIVTDSLKKIIEGLKPTNITFSKVGQ